MKRVLALIIALLLAVPAVLAEGSVGSVNLGSFVFTPLDEWEVWDYGDGGYIIEYENITGAVRYFTYEEIGMSKDDFIVEQDGTTGLMLAPLTIDALFRAQSGRAGCWTAIRKICITAKTALAPGCTAIPHPM